MRPLAGTAQRRVFLVRHGETVGNSATRFYGATDVALADLGRRQIAALIPRLADECFAAVVHSPLARATESAAILCAGLRTAPPSVESDATLLEVDFGVFEGKTIEAIEAADPQWFRRWRDGEAEGFPGGDVLADFRSRVARGFDALLARFPAGQLLVVVHKGVVKAVLAACLGVGFDQLRTWPLDLGSLHVLERIDGNWQLVERNHTGTIT